MLFQNIPKFNHLAIVPSSFPENFIKIPSKRSKLFCRQTDRQTTAMAEVIMINYLVEVMIITDVGL